jgi:hypothetical protein
MTIRERMAKIIEGMPTYGTKPALKGNSRGGPEKKMSADDVDAAINGVGAHAIPTANNKGPGKPEPEVGKGKKGAGKAIGLKGRMESLLGLGFGEARSSEAIDLDDLNLKGMSDYVVRIVDDIDRMAGRGDLGAVKKWAKAMKEELSALSTACDSILARK